MSAQRPFFLVVASVLVLGICLSGYQQVYWLLYIPPLFLAFAGITGICPGLIIMRKRVFK